MSASASTGKILADNREKILAAWVEGQSHDPRIRRNLMSGPETAQESARILDALIAVTASEKFDDTSAPEFGPIKHLLAETAIRRQQLGFTALETVASIMSVKDYWRPLVREAYQDHPDVLDRECTRIARLIDTLGLEVCEALLRESEERQRLMIESVKDYGIIMLDATGHVTSWNAGAERIKGYKAEEILGKHFSVFFPPEDVQRGKTEMELEVAATQGRFEDTGWRVRKDGSRFWANVVFTPVHDKAGNLRGFAKITRDITDRKQAEEKLHNQAQEILELSTPVVQVWNGIVAVPLIGSLDSQRTQLFMERLLERIVETNSPVALVDITGVPTIDTQTAQHLVETITAVRLLGAQVVLTGVRPAIAQTLVHLGIDLSGITTRSSMEGGLRVALDMLGLHVASKNGQIQNAR